MADELNPQPPQPEPTPPEQPIDPNLVAAQDGQNDSEQLVECPKCGHLRRKFVIVDGGCDSCRTRGQAAQIVNTLGWPEVRHRRNMLILETDHTQLSDRSDEVKAAWTEWRQNLRDITAEESDPLKAWYKLDELTANRPSE